MILRNVKEVELGDHSNFVPLALVLVYNLSWRYVLQWMNKLSSRAIWEKFDKRSQQHEIDVHKLYLLASHHHDVMQGNQIESNYADLKSEQAAEMGFKGQWGAVNSMLCSQVLDYARVLQSIVGSDRPPQNIPQDPKSVVQPLNKRGMGLAMATGVDLSAIGKFVVCSQSGKDEFVPKMSLSQVTACLKELSGYSLSVSPSSVSHEEAGNGLWIDGCARLGSVVALYPGIIYEPLWYRQMADYPRVDANNHYLLSRFDGGIVDGKPWGLGLTQLDQPFVQDPANFAEKCLNSLEGRNPLALAHFANHPGKFNGPNTMVASIDLSLSDQAILRPHIPNILFRGKDTSVLEGDSVLPTLVFVALRDLEDEEIFLNYRLSPHVPRPSWYIPINTDEEWRRWS